MDVDRQNMVRQLSGYRWCGLSIAVLCLLSTFMMSNSAASEAGQQTTIQPQDNGRPIRTEDAEK